MKLLGIDIGTSTVCGVVYDTGSRRLRPVTKANDSAIQNGPAWAFRQDARRILEIVHELLDELLEPDVSSIGFSGQMHGMLYLDAQGDALSPLFTWQDGSAAQPYKEGFTYAGWLSHKTGHEVAPGYGLATHFYNLACGTVPEGTTWLCTVMDYVAMHLCNTSRPLCDPSNAASLGFFDKRALAFDTSSLGVVGIDAGILPEVAGADTIVGHYKGIPVHVPIGDNQAAFLGSVTDKESAVSVTIGTSSQISVYTPEYVDVPSLDTRPLPGGGYLLVGAALCGGCSFAMLKDFYAKVMETFSGERPSDEEIYDKMCLTAASDTGGLTVRTTFEGTRRDASLCGEISGINLKNLTPDRLTTALLKGICQELRDFYDLLPARIRGHRSVIVGSGNALRKNPLLQQLLSEAFALPVTLSPHREESATGAAICAGARDVHF